MKKVKIITDPEFGYKRVEKIPTQDEVDKFYAQDFYSANYQFFNDSSLEVQKEEKDFFEARYNDILSYIKKLHPDARTIFDIGFGFAQALLYFKDKGFDVSGIEPSTEGVQYAKEHGLSNVYGAGIEDFDVVGTNRYDVVMLLNVLEHLRYPAETIKEIKNKLMTKDGLLIIEVPNEFNDFQMVANDEYNLNDWWICPPNHINYFSASSLENLLEKSGFTIVKKEASFPLELFMLMGDVYVGNDNLGKECHNKRVLFESLMRKHNKSDKLADFYSRLAELDLGRQIILYARPTN